MELKRVDPGQSKDEMTGRDSEIVVIGGGVIGCAIAYYLAKEGRKVLLVEKDDIACEASGANTGSINVQSRTPGLERQLGWSSAEMFPYLQEELDYDIEYVRNGTLIFFDSFSDLMIAKQRVGKQMEAGLKIELLNGDEARKLCPILSEDIIGATYCALDASVNPIKLTLGFAEAARRLGTKILIGTEVKGIGLDGHRVSSVITNHRKIHTELVINAAGMGAVEICRAIGVEIPVFPLFVQLMVTEPIAPIAPVARGLLMHTTEMKAATGYLRAGFIQTQHGEVIIGGFSRILSGRHYGEEVSLEGISGMAQLIKKFAPGLLKLNIVRSWVGITAATPDEFPILGEVEGIKGFLLATGHTGEGCAQAPITGRIIADLVMHRETFFPLDSLKLSRFSNVTYSQRLK